MYNHRNTCGAQRCHGHSCDPCDCDGIADGTFEALLSATAKWIALAAKLCYLKVKLVFMKTRDALARAIVGKIEFRTEVVSFGRCEAQLPEWEYQADFLVERKIRDFTRWGIYDEKHTLRITFDPPGVPIPNIEGRDETIKEIYGDVDWEKGLKFALDDFAKYVMFTRQQNGGGMDWRPADGWKSNK